MRTTIAVRGLAAGALLAALGSIPASVAAETYQIDKAHTTVGFAVRHILTKVRGKFKEFDGTFTFDPKQPEKTTGTFTAKAASIDTGIEQRDAHLRSEDFFHAEKYPELRLVVKRMNETKERGIYTMTADLTIRDVTKPVTFEVTHLGTSSAMGGKQKAAFEARAKINRKDFGLAWNKILEGGTFLVGEEVELLIDVEADAK
jgi:polyisoprenoid-binding protein YceI